MKLFIFLLLLIFTVAVKLQNVEETGTLQRSKRNADECSKAFYDFYILVDVTSAVGAAGLPYVKTYLTNIARGLNLGAERARVSLTSFGTRIKNVGNLNQLQNLQSVTGAIDSLRIERGLRNRYSSIAAMNYMADNLFTEEHGLRSTNKSVCILIFARLFGGNPMDAAERLQKNCNVVVVGLKTATFRRNRVSTVASGSGQTVTSRRIRSLPTRTTTTLSIICHKRLQGPLVFVVRTTPNTGTIRWKKPQYSVKNYKATIRRSSTSRIEQSFSRIRASQSELTFRNLQMATTYVVTMSATGQNDIESKKRQILFSTGLPIPTPRVRKSTITTSSAVLFWNRLPRARYYINVTLLERKEKSTSDLTRDTQYRLTGLKSGSRYRVTISSLLLTIRSEESTPVFFQTNSDPPTLKVERVRLTEVILRWKAVSGAVYYNVTMRAQESDEVRHFPRIRDTRFRIGNLVASAAYEFTATTMGQNGIISVVSLPLLVITAPSNPENVQMTSVTKTSISFEWDSVEAALRYRIKVTSTDNNRFRIDENTQQTNFTISRLKSGFDYRIIVLSVGRNDVVDENVVDPLLVQTVPSPPTQLRSSRATPTSITIEWDESKGAGRYIVLTWMEGEANNVTRTNATRPSATVKGLLPGTAYNFQVITEGIRGRRSTASRTIRESTYAAVAQTPNVTSINNTFIAIQLYPAEGATSYVINTRGEFGVRGRTLQRRRTVSDISSPYVISGLHPGNWYNVTVSTVNRFDRRNPVLSSSLYEQTVPSAPLVGTFRDIQSTSLVYTWRRAEGAKSYALYVIGDDVNGDEVTVEHLTTSTTYYITDLIPGTRYEFRLQSLSFQDRRSRIGRSGVRRTVPGLTKNIRTIHVTTDSIRLAWDATRGASRYRVVMVTNNPNSPTRYSVSRTGISISGLNHGSWYNFTIFSRSSQGFENPAGSELVRVQTVPLPTSNVQISEQTAQSYMASWDPSEGALGYNVHAVTAERSVRNRETIVRVNGSTSALVDNLASGALYRFFVVVVGFQEQTSSRSEAVSGLTLPSSPSNVFLDEVSTSRIAISWSQIRGAVQFAVSVTQYISQNVTSWEILTNRNFIELEGLLSGAWYNLSIFSIGVEDKRNPEPSPLIRAQTVPASPIALDFYDITTSSISMRWDPVRGASSYIVIVRAASSNQVIKRMPTRTTSVVADGLEPGTTYVFQLITIGHDEGRRSSSSAIREETIPSTPDTPIIVDVTDNSVQLDWNSVKGSRKYIVDVRNSRDEIVQSVEAYVNNAIIHDLESGTQYSFSVSSVGVRNRRNPISSGVVAAYTAPSHPEGIRTDEIETNSFRLRWNAVHGALYYMVRLRSMAVVRSSSNEKIVGPLNDTEILVNQLSPGTEYHVFIQAIGKEERKSELQPPYRDATLPNTPNEPIAERVRTTSLRLSWPNTPGALKYLVYVRQEGQQEEEEFESSTSNYVISDLLPGTRYTFSVQAVGALDRLSASRSPSIEHQTLTEPPTEINVTSTKSTSITLQWDRVTGASSYFLLTTSEENEVSEMFLTENMAQLTNLEPGSDYNFEVRSIGDNNVQSMEATEIEETTLPLPPTNITISNVTSSSIQLNWLDVKGADDYLVVVNVTTTFNVSSAEANIENLQAGEYYVIQIYSIDMKNRTSENASLPEVIQTVPSSPLFRLDSVTNTSFLISWRDVYGASSYQFEIRAIDTEISDDVIEIETDNANLTATDLQPGVAYSVEASSLGRQSNRKSTPYRMTVYTLPSVPQSLQEIEVTTTSITVQWTPSQGAQNYEVELLSNFLNEHIRQRTPNSSLTITGLAPGDTYRIRVFAIGIQDLMNLQGSSAINVQTVTLPPAHLSFDEVTITSFSMRWSESLGAKSYKIYIREKGRENSDSANMISVNDTSATVTSLAPGTPYVVRIYSVGSKNVDSAEGAQFETTTLSAIVETIYVRNVTTSSIALEWDDMLGAIRYVVETRRIDSESTDELTTETTVVPTYTALNLSPGATYSFVVFTVSVGDIQSEEGSPALTQQTVTLPPTEVEISSVTVTSFLVEWEEVFGATSYNVYVYKLTVNGPEPFNRSSGSSTSRSMTSLEPGTEYMVRVTAIGSSSLESAESTGIRATTKPEAVRFISSFNVQSYSADVEWMEAQGALNYVINLVNLDDELTTRIETRLTSANLRNLIPGTRYRIEVVTVGVQSRTNTNESVVAFLQTVPLPPTQIRFSNVTTTSFTISWTSSFGADSYRIFLNSFDEDVPNDITTEQTSYVVTSLSPGTQYFVSLISLLGETLSSQLSDSYQETTLPETPSAVNFLDVTETSISLFWNSVKGAESYEILYRERGSNALPDEAVSTRGEATITDLKPGRWYEIVVYSVGVRGRRNDRGSDPLSLQTIPLPPTSVTVENVMPTSLIVRWVNSKGAAFYRVSYWAGENSSPTTIETASHMQELAGLRSGVEYTFTVRSVGEEGQASDPSEKVVQATLPATPTDVRASNISTTTAYLSWTSQIGAERYQVSVLNVVANTTEYFSTNSTSFLVPNLLAGTQYRFIVFSIGVNDKMNKRGSRPITRQTVPRPPIRIQLNEVEENTIEVTWNAVTGAGSYYVVVTSADEDAFVPAAIVTSQTSTSFPSLTSGTVYSFTITTIGLEQQRSVPSRTVSRTILPGKPVQVRASSLSTTSFNIRWASVKGAPRYRVVVTSRENDDVQESESDTNEIVVTSLMPGSRYAIVVFSFSSDDRLNSEGSDPIMKQTLTSRPTRVRSSEVTTTSLSISWQAVFGAQSYRVTTQSNDTEAQIPTVVTTTNSFTIVRNLSSGTRYTFSVVGLNYEGEIGVLSRPLTQTTLPATPRGVSLVEVGTTTVALRWNPVKGAASYRVALYDGESEEERTLNVRTAYAEVNELDPGTWYIVEIFSEGIDLENNEGSERQLFQTVPLRPTNLQIAVNETELTSIHVSWLRSKGALNYRVSISSPEGSNVFVPRPVTTPLLNIKIPNLTYGTRYDVTVLAIGEEDNESENSETESVVIAPTTVGTPSITQITETSFNVEWNPVKGAVSYFLFITNIENDKVREEEINQPRALVNLLEPGTTYDVYVLSMGAEQLNPNESPRVRKQTVPLPPSELSTLLASLTTSSLSLSWEPVRGASRYEIYFSSSDLDERSVTSDVNTAEVNNLLPGTEYQFQVLSVGVEGQRSSRSTRIAAATKPGAVSQIRILGTTTTSVTLQWNAAPGAQSYRIEIENLDDNVTFSLETRNTESTVSNLRPGTRFWFNIVSIGPLTRENVNENAKVYGQTVPNPPRTMDVTEIRTESMELVWSPARGASLYQVVISWNETDQSRTRNLTTERTQISIDGLLPGTRYHFATISITEGGVFSTQNKGTTETTRPAMTTNLLVSAVTTNSTTLRWDPVKGARYYEVLFGVRNSPIAKSIIEARESQLTIDGLQEGTWYGFVVFSIGRRGRKSEQSSSELFVQTVPVAPSCPLVSNVTTTSLRLTWNAVLGAESYQVRIVRSENGQERNLNSEDLMTQVVSLEAGTEYEFYVTAIGEQDQRSEESEVKVDSTLPNTPSSVTVERVTSTITLLSWSNEKGALRYKVLIRDSSGRTQTIYSSESNVEIDELLPGERYVAMVSAMGAKNRTNPTPSKPLMFQTVPLSPSQIRSTSVTTSQIRIEWDSEFGAQSYDVRVVNDDDSSEDDVTVRTTGNNITLFDLIPGTRYGFYVTSIGYGTIRSEESAVYHESTLPSTPTNLQVSRRTTSSAIVNWDSVKGATFFTLSITSNNTEEDFTVISENNNMLLENLVSGGWYEVIITSTGIKNRTNPVESESLHFQTVPQPPRNARISSVLTDEIAVEWDEVLGASSYLITYVRNNGRQREIQTQDTSYTIRNLISGTQYDIILTTVAQNGLTSSDTTRLSEITTINAPTAIGFKNETTNSVILTWNPVEGAIRYFVYQSLSDNVERFETSRNEITITGLEPGTNYRFSVGTIDKKQRESSSTSRRVEIQTISLPVRNVQIEELGSQSFTARWNEPKGADEYEVVLLRNEVTLSNSTVQRNSFTFTGLASGTLYRLVITVININDQRSEMTTIEQRTAPRPPSGLRVSSVRSTSLNLTWNSVVGGRFYDVYIINLEDPVSIRIERFEGTETSLDGLQSGTEYGITIVSFTEEEIRSTRNASIIQSTIPAAPENVVGVPLNHTAVRLSWNNVRGATEYTVYYFGSPKTARNQLRQGENIIEGIRATFIVINGLQPELNYMFSVVASNGEDLRSDRSEPIVLEIFTPPPVLPISDDPLVVASNIMKRSFLASWDPILNAVAYVVIVKNAAAVDDIVIGGQNSTQVLISSLTPNTVYTVSIKAVGASGAMTNESFPPAQVITRPLAPMRPFGVRVTKIRSTYFELAWESMPRALAYDVSVVDEARQARISLNNIRGTTANVTNLRVLNYYNVTVSSVGRYETSPPSSPVRVLTRYPVPAIPRRSDLINIDDVTYDSMRITVAPVEYATSYVIIIRQKGIVRRRISDVQASVPVSVDNLQQNTVYDVTYEAVGRGGERSIESEVIRTRTQELKPIKEGFGRLIPSLPVDFQVISVTPSQITVRWRAARHAESYRVSVTNSRTGITKFYNNATSPFDILGLEFRETYAITVSSVGLFFSSAYVQPITVEIPYPEAEPVRGLQLSQIATTSFLLRWDPAPYAVSYTIILDEIGGRRREIRNIRRILFRVQNLKQNTEYNATVQAVSHNGEIVPAERWVSARTGQGLPTSTEAPEDDSLASVIQEIVKTLRNIPESVLDENTQNPEEESQTKRRYRNLLRELLDQLRIVVSINLQRHPPPPGVPVTLRVNDIRRFDVAMRPTIDTLFAFVPELKLFVRSNDTSEATADSIANRLTRELTALLIATPTPLAPLIRHQNQDEIRDLLLIVVSHELDDVRTAGNIEIELGGHPSQGVRVLTVFIKPASITSRGFTLVWGRYGNVHRYEIVIEKVAADGRKHLVDRRVLLRQSLTLNNLTSSTTYSLTVRPMDASGSIIPGVIGQTDATTAAIAEALFQVNVTSIDFNAITLSWEQFPAAVSSMTFRVFRQGSERVQQEIQVNRVHRNVQFTSLLPGTTYRITASSNSFIFLDRTITTLSSGLETSVSETRLPVRNTMSAPTGLRLLSQSGNRFVIQWLPVPLPASVKRSIAYNIRLYEPGTRRLRRYKNFQRSNRAIIELPPLHLMEYDVTVSAYNLLTRSESPQSRRFRVNLRQNARG